MQKGKIATVVHTGTSTWKDKTLEKYLVVFDNGDNGTLTTGFSADDKAPEIGDELEYTIEDKGFGNEIKLPRKSKGFSGGGGAKKWSTEQIAQQDAVKLTVAYLEQRSDIEDWKQFFVEAKQFMIAQIKADEASTPAEPVPAEPKKESEDKLPF